MKDETRIRSAAGRKVLADPRTHRYYLCLNDGENKKFISMFEQSGMKNKAGIYLCPYLRLRVQGSED